jgi:hypothetical protein
MKRERLFWQYVTQPTALGREYTIRITYQLGKRPEILVMDPNLIELAGDRRIPHLYQQDPPSLCLYMPAKREWTPMTRIDQTIVPWTVLWLFYFEEWLDSNEWKGGGEHPAKIDEATREAHA